MFSLTKGGKFHNVITHIVIWANQKTSFRYCWLCAHAMFDITYFPTFVKSIEHHVKYSVDTVIVTCYNICSVCRSCLQDKGRKGVSHLIEIENPNRVIRKNKKMNELDNDATAAKGPQLSRRERYMLL